MGLKKPRRVPQLKGFGQYRGPSGKSAKNTAWPPESATSTLDDFRGSLIQRAQLAAGGSPLKNSLWARVRRCRINRDYIGVMILGLPSKILCFRR